MNQDKTLEEQIRFVVQGLLHLCAKDFLDCGEVNTTKLAEATVDGFSELPGFENVHEWLDDDTHSLWDICADEALKYERRSA